MILQRFHAGRAVKLFDIAGRREKSQVVHRNFRQCAKQRAHSQIGIVFPLGITHDDDGSARQKPRGEHLSELQFPVR